MIRPSDALLLLPFTVFVPPLLAHSSDHAPAPPVSVPLLADGFDFPVGRPDARGYYDAQPFGRNRHLGEDWNGNGGGNTDLGDPVYSIAHGVVSFTGHVSGGWGNIVRVVHTFEIDGERQQVESFYAHLHEIAVKEGDLVRRGALLGTIGDADGRYYAHLHLELRDRVGMPHGPGYSEAQDGWLSPSDFILAHRRLKP